MADKCSELPAAVAVKGDEESDHDENFGRLEDELRQGGEWYRWGPYLSERQCGTVREDYSADFEIEYPTGSGKRLTLDLIVVGLQDRLISLFTRDADGRLACFGGTEKMQADPAWKDNRDGTSGNNSWNCGAEGPTTHPAPARNGTPRSTATTLPARQRPNARPAIR